MCLGRMCAGNPLQRGRYTRVCQDELGSRDRCESAATAALKNGGRVILDRCNVTLAERKLWYGLTPGFSPGRTSKKGLCVWLDLPPSTCISRAKERKNHPTIKQKDYHKVGMIVGSFVKRMVPPTRAEGLDVARYQSP